MEILLLLDTVGVLGIISASITAAGGLAVTILKLVKTIKENKVLIEQDKKREILLKHEKQLNFYMKLAHNLVLSAEKLSLTGPQKKEYVMTWMENEAVKSSIKVDYALMSECIEDTIIILNDHRTKGTDYETLKNQVINDHVDKLEEIIDAENEAELAKIKINNAASIAIVENVVEEKDKQKEAAKEILKKVKKQ